MGAPRFRGQGSARTPCCPRMTVCSAPRPPDPAALTGPSSRSPQVTFSLIRRLSTLELLWSLKKQPPPTGCVLEARRLAVGGKGAQASGTPEPTAEHPSYHCYPAPPAQTDKTPARCGPGPATAFRLSPVFCIATLAGNSHFLLRVAASLHPSRYLRGRPGRALCDTGAPRACEPQRGGPEMPAPDDAVQAADLLVGAGGWALAAWLFGKATRGQAGA